MERNKILQPYEVAPETLQAYCCATPTAGKFSDPLIKMKIIWTSRWGVCLCLRTPCICLNLPSSCAFSLYSDAATAEVKSSIRSLSRTSHVIFQQAERDEYSHKLIIHECLMQAAANPAHKAGVSNQARTLYTGVSI